MKAAIPALLAAVIGLSTTSAALAQDRVWRFTETEEGVHLVYGQPESDDVQVALYCERGTDRAGLVVWFEHRVAADAPNPDGEWIDAEGAPAPWPATLGISVRDSGFTLSGDAVHDEISDGTALEVQTPTATPYLKAFAASGRIAFKAYGETIKPGPANPADIRAFIAGCAPRRK